MPKPLTIRRLDQGPMPGPWNMAVDDALLQACIAGAVGFPCVRFYAWEPPTLSLGMHQDVAVAADAAALRRMGVDLVRRLTGGRAVLHDRELTYAVIAPSRHGPLAGSVMAAYRRISEALVDGLARLGLDAELSAGEAGGGPGDASPCFTRLSPCEVHVDGIKVIGSVQLQRGGCLLQHGSIPLRGDPARLARATGGAETGPLKGLEDLLDRELPLPELVEALAAGFAARLDAEVIPGSLTPAEEASARHLSRTRYASREWNDHPPRRRPRMTPRVS